MKNRFKVHGVSNRLWSTDLAPIPREERTWSASRFFHLWGMISVSIPTYLLASGLLALGMNWKQALGTMLLGNGIVLAPMILNAHAGAKFGIPFPVYARASFGVVGAHVPAVLRALVACGWFGIQCWIGGLALFALVRLWAPGFADGAVWLCFAAVWLLAMLLLQAGEHPKTVQPPSAALLLIAATGLLYWMVEREAGSALAGVSAVRPTVASPFWLLFLPALTGVAGFWAVVVLQVSDYTRYAESQREQAVGAAMGLPAAMVVYSAIGMAVTAATVLAGPEHGAVWNPIDLVASLHQPVLATVVLAAVVWASLQANLAAHTTRSANDLSSLKPQLISVRMGRLLAGVLGVLWMPWRLLADPERYLAWLLLCSGLLGPVAGVMIVDYFVVRRRLLDIEGLYVRGGPYEYTAGFNVKALTALAVGICLAMVGWVVPVLHWLFDGAGFVGFGAAGLVYLLLMSGPAEMAEIPPTPLLIPMAGFEGEGA